MTSGNHKYFYSNNKNCEKSKTIYLADQQPLKATVTAS